MNIITIACPTQNSFLKTFLGAFLIPKRRMFQLAEIPCFVTARQGIRVRQKQLTAYREVCGSPKDDYVPILYPYILTSGMQTHLLSQYRFPLRIFSLVHERNQIIQYRPIEIRQTLDAICQVGHYHMIENGLKFDMEVDVYANGELVWKTISTYLCRGHFKDADPNAPRPSLAEIATPNETIEWSVPKNVGRRYARITGDYNPIHVSSLVAKLFGFPRSIVHGMWLAGVCATRLTGPLLTYPATYDVLFKGPVFPGSNVRVLIKEVKHECRFDLYCDDNPSPCLCGLITTS